MTIYFNNSDDNIKISKTKLTMLAAHYKQMSNVLKSEPVQELLKKWQGKQYNKRLETALKKIDEHFYIDRQCGTYLTYNFYGQNERSFKYYYIHWRGNPNYQWVYLDTYKHCIRHITKSVILEDCNTICDDIAKQILEMSEYYNRKYIEMTRQLDNLDNIMKEYKDLIEKLNNFTDSVDSDIKAEFKMYVINQS